MTSEVTIFELDSLGTIAGTQAVEVEIQNSGNYYLTLQRLRDWTLTGVWGLPAGGTSGQVLTKSGTVDGVAGWTTLTIPTQTSQLANNSGFITSAAIPTNVSAFTNDANYTTLAAVGAVGYLTGIPDNSVTIPKLSATGTANNTTYLRGDGTWSTVSVSGSAITVSDEGTTLTSNATSFNFTGTGVTATNSGGAVTVNVSAGSGSSLTTSVITSNTTAVSNTRYLCNTSSGSFTLTLPASPSNGDVIEIADFNNSSLLTGFGVNPLTITANTGHNIVGNTNLVLDRGGQGVELVFHTNRWSIVSGIGESSTLVLLQNQLLAEVQAVMLAGGL